MSAPNMEMIVASLRSFSLELDKEVPSPAVEPPPVEEVEEEVIVELNSEVALPYQWEQCLDMKTGEIYFINSATGARTTEDPRLTGYYLDEEYYSDDVSDYSDDDTVSDCNDDDDDGICNINSIDGFVATDNSCSSSPEAAAETDPPVLVAAGCTSCHMFIMAPKDGSACPKCGRQLLYLGRNGYF